MWPLQRLLASTKRAGVQYVSGMKLTYFADGIPAAYKMAQVFLLIDFIWRGRVKLMPASSLENVFFFSLSNTSISFLYACVSPLFFLPIFVCCFIFLYIFFSMAWTHTVSVVNGENLKDANSVCFCLVVSRHHQKDDTLHAMQVVVYYFYLPRKKKRLKGINAVH